MSVFTELRSSMQKRAKYRATVRELSALDASVARDLNIAPSQIHRIAHEAVYG